MVLISLSESLAKSFRIRSMPVAFVVSPGSGWLHSVESAAPILGLDGGNNGRHLAGTPSPKDVILVPHLSNLTLAPCQSSTCQTAFKYQHRTFEFLHGSPCKCMSICIRRKIIYCQAVLLLFEGYSCVGLVVGNMKLPVCVVPGASDILNSVPTKFERTLPQVLLLALDKSCNPTSLHRSRVCCTTCHKFA